MRVEVQLLCDDARPTPIGSRRRPRTREWDVRRPSSTYRTGMSHSLAWLMAHERAREERTGEDT